MAGVPIYKVLEEMGVKGTATADDIEEAFKRMTSEGGTFFDAMGKGAATLQGKVTNLEGAWKTFKATFAETTGLGKFLKKEIDDLSEGLNYIIDLLNTLEVLRGAKNNREAGDRTTSNEVAIFESEIKILEAKIQDFQSRIDSGFQRYMIPYWERSIKKWQNEIQIMRDDNILLQEKNERIKEAKSLLEQESSEVEKLEKKYSGLSSFIEEIYAETEQGQKSILENKIQQVQNYLKDNKKLGDIIKWGPAGQKATFYGEIALDSSDIEKANIDLVYLQKKLEELQNKNKSELADWQKIMKQTFGFTDAEDSFLSTGVIAVDHFIENMENARNKLSQSYEGKTVAELLGLTALDQASADVDKLKNSLQSLLGAKPKDAEEWSLGDKSIQNLLDDLRKAETLKQNLSFDDYLQGLDREYELLLMGNEQREKALFLDSIKELNFSPDQADALWQGKQKNQDRGKFNRETEAYNDFLKQLDRESELITNNPALKVFNQIKQQLQDAGIEQPRVGQIKTVLKKNEENYLKDLGVQLKDAGKSTYDLAVKRLMIEQNISAEAAKQALETQKQIDYITNGYDIMGELEEQIKDALRSIRAGEGGQLEYAGARFAQAGMELTQGSDVGNFIEGFQQGGIWGAVIETLVGALVKVIGGMEEFEKAMNPVTHLLSNLSSVVNFLHDIIMQVFNDVIVILKPAFVLIGEILQSIQPLLSEMIHTITEMLKDATHVLAPVIGIVRMLAPVFSLLGQAVRTVFDGLRWFANWLTGGMLDINREYVDSLAEMTGAQQEETERLKALNEQYKNLYASLKEQEEYYLQQRRHLNAEWAIENYQATPVHDMILSPHGAFSTDPDDYIIATKNPQSLGGGSAPVYVTVINNSTSTITTQESSRADGSREIQVIVDQLVQNGLASGKYDGAMDAMSQRRRGKVVSR
jgi:hypothetical protein